MKQHLLIFLFLFYFISYSQVYNLSGTIVDNNDKSPLIGVNILFGDNQGAISNIDGEYELWLKPGKHSIRFQYLGYATYLLEINIKKD